MSALVTFHNASLGYPGRVVVPDFSGRIEGGSLTAVVGPNGGGKSTLLKTTAGLLQPLSGRLVRDGLGRADVAYLPQQSKIDRLFPASVFDLVSLGLWRQRRLFGSLSPANHRAAIGSALADVGMPHLEREPIANLSGGQLQRALFARVILQDARLVLLDEPFTAIDPDTVEDLLAIVDRWHAGGRTIVVVLHDVDLARRHFPETLLLSGAIIGWGPTSEVLTAEALQDSGSGKRSRASAARRAA